MKINLVHTLRRMVMKNILPVTAVVVLLAIAYVPTKALGTLPAGPVPAISITDINTITPKFELDEVIISGTVQPCRDITVAIICADTILVNWGDGSQESIGLALEEWGPASHVYDNSSSGSVQISVELTSNQLPTGWPRDSVDISVLKDSTSLSPPILSAYSVAKGETIKVTGTLLRDLDTGTIIAGKPISYTGSAVFDSTIAISTSDGNFDIPVEIISSDDGGSDKTIYAEYAGDSAYIGSVSPTSIVEIVLPEGNICQEGFYSENGQCVFNPALFSVISMVITAAIISAIYLYIRSGKPSKREESDLGINVRVEGGLERAEY